MCRLAHSEYGLMRLPLSKFHSCTREPNQRLISVLIVLNLSNDVCVCASNRMKQRFVLRVRERKKASTPWHTHQFNPVKLNNFSKICNMQYRCYMTASHLMKQYVSTSIGFIWAVEIWARKFGWQVRPFKGVLCEHNVR